MLEDAVFFLKCLLGLVLAWCGSGLLIVAVVWLDHWSGGALDGASQAFVDFINSLLPKKGN